MSERGHLDLDTTGREPFRNICRCPPGRCICLEIPGQVVRVEPRCQCSCHWWPSVDHGDPCCAHTGQHRLTDTFGRTVWAAWPPEPPEDTGDWCYDERCEYGLGRPPANGSRVGERRTT